MHYMCIQLLLCLLTQILFLHLVHGLIVGDVMPVDAVKPVYQVIGSMVVIVVRR